MARPERNNIDYFPHEVNNGKKMHYIESKYKNDGYAVWHKLLEALGKADYHYLDISEDITLMFLASSFNVTEIVLKEIIKDLVRLNVFNKDLYENGILYNQKFVDSISDAYLKRNNSIITEISLRELLEAKGRIIGDKSTPKLPKSTLKGVSNPHRIEEYIKEEESKLYISISPFIEKYGKEMCRKFYEYWSEPNNKKTKIKYQMEKTWDIEKRLKRWSESNFNKPKTEEKLVYTAPKPFEIK